MEAQLSVSVEDPVTFDRPPVGEVALAVQFAQPATDDSLTLGAFWPRVRDEYPSVETQPPLPPMSEDFGPPGLPSVSFQLVGPSSRYWLLSADATELIQVQPDRFGFNWRKDPADAPYPRYRRLRERFERVFSAFVASVAESGRTAQATWCEITYINPIPAGDSSGGLRDLSTILRRLSPERPDFLPPPQDSNFAERFVLTRAEAPIGRFYVSATPALRMQDRTPMYVLTFTARGMPISPDVAGVLAFLDEGRDRIVRSFRDMTTTEMHETWGLRESN